MIFLRFLIWLLGCCAVFSERSGALYGRLSYTTVSSRPFKLHIKGWAPLFTYTAFNQYLQHESSQNLHHKNIFTPIHLMRVLIRSSLIKRDLRNPTSPPFSPLTNTVFSRVQSFDILYMSLKSRQLNGLMQEHNSVYVMHIIPSAIFRAWYNRNHFNICFA